ncbi:uncharacterized protein LOC119765960 [Culex quinquefasciatus]|uniref:uncharacterized protein LOC119765960 n=1 Tax=Culex quinquefasciatus TaxID=7176 RepID=UPI0018E38180|nr:uncharacterized protein LOC119765960 [Culex quinquefasciatus]
MTAYSKDLLPDLRSQHFSKSTADEASSSFLVAYVILAEAIIGGDLKNPSKAIPGAIPVIILTSVSSDEMASKASANVVLDATGNVSEMAMELCRVCPGKCKYARCFAATLSSSKS